MDTNKAVEQLESVRPDSNDLSAPEFQDAITAIEADADLELAFHQRLDADRRIGEVMQDVNVPAGLKERLLSSVVRENFEEPVVVDSVVKPNRSLKFLWLTVAATVVGAGLLGIWLSDSSQLTLADLEKVPVSASVIDKLPVFDSFDLTNSATVTLLAPRKSRSWNSTGTQTALIHFMCKGRACVLLVVPTDSASTELTSARTVMLNGKYAMRGWHEARGTLVCVLVVEGNQTDLRAVESVLKGRLT
jgi:hypothetical protein